MATGHDTDSHVIDGLHLRFPGSWWQIPLIDPGEARESARRLVVESIGRADQHAQLRAEMRLRLETAITEAREANAVRFAIAIEIVPDIPIPAFLGIFETGTDLRSAPSTDAAAVMNLFASGFDKADSAHEFDPENSGVVPFERFAVGRSHVARRVRYRVIPAEGEAPEVTNLIVEFWMTVPGQRKIVLLAFTSPAVALIDPLLNLFGAIVASAQWDA